MLDSPLLPPREDMPRDAKSRIVVAAAAYWRDRPALQDETPIERWAEYVLDRVLRGMEPLDLSTRETIPVSEFTG